jgi:hypothetical protein
MDETVSNPIIDRAIQTWMFSPIFTSGENIPVPAGLWIGKTLIEV